MALALRAYAESSELCRNQGKEARRTIENEFGMEAMVNGYIKIYDTWLAKNARRKGAEHSVRHLGHLRRQGQARD